MIRNFKDITDEKLVILLQLGEVEALWELYNRYSKRLLRYFYNMLWQDQERAQDFLQEIFAKLIERPKHFNPDKKFSTWVFSVAHNMCKNEYRRNSRWQEVASRITIEVDGAGMVEEDELIDNVTFKKSFERALTQLNPGQQSAFTLRYQENLTVQEIASVLDCSQGTVKSRIFYAKKKLAQILQIYDPFKTEG